MKIYKVDTEYPNDNPFCEVNFHKNSEKHFGFPLRNLDPALKKLVFSFDSQKKNFS